MELGESSPECMYSPGVPGTMALGGSPMRTTSSSSGVFSLPSPPGDSALRHDALGFEYIDQSKNFVPQVAA